MGNVGCQNNPFHRPYYFSMTIPYRPVNNVCFGTNIANVLSNNQLDLILLKHQLYIHVCDINCTTENQSLKMLKMFAKKPGMYSVSFVMPTTLFSKCLAHENHPNFLKFLGHRPQPRVISILSIGLESNVVFCILLPRPFDKLDMTWGWGQ